jgi:hypothetical protein
MSLKSTILVWLAVLPVMVVNGIVREAVLVRVFGRVASDILSAVFGILIVLGVTGFFLRRVSNASMATLVRTSLVWLALTVVFEFLFGHYVDKKAWSELVANYELWNGRTWPLVLAALVLSPFVWVRPNRNDAGAV